MKCDIPLWRHQQALLTAIAMHPDCELFFMTAGYGAGKSFTGVMLILSLASQYQGRAVTIGIGGDTIKRLRQTLLADLFRLCQQWGITYKQSTQRSELRIGTVLFVEIAMSNPDLIYGYNFSAFIGDEIDELTQEKAVEVFRAAQERTRVTFPNGRAPFLVFMTTAQGYRGMYRIVNDLEAKGIKFWMVRGCTRDNRALSSRYVGRLESIYNEIERQVFLEGRFANLTTGRVYYDYDESRDMLTEEPFTVQPSDTVKVGQDLNAGYSHGVAIVKRGKVLYVVRHWIFGEIGHAPKKMRTDFPANRIEWYPDASGREILAGYREEMEQHDIETWTGSVNPSVIDRIFIVNKLFAMGKLKLFPGLHDLSMALKTRQYDNKGDPEKGKGPSDPSHRTDPLEYDCYRIVRDDEDFADIYEATRISRVDSLPEEPWSEIAG